MWGMALFVSLLLPVITLNLGRRDPVVPLGFFRLTTTPLFSMLILFILSPVISGFWLWIRMYGAKEKELE
jgi:hypothetical protein